MSFVFIYLSRFPIFCPSVFCLFQLQGAVWTGATDLGFSIATTQAQSHEATKHVAEICVKSFIRVITRGLMRGELLWHYNVGEEIENEKENGNRMRATDWLVCASQLFDTWFIDILLLHDAMEGHGLLLVRSPHPTRTTLVCSNYLAVFVIQCSAPWQLAFTAFFQTRTIGYVCPWNFLVIKALKNLNAVLYPWSESGNKM